jgi:hypothetical protein
VAERDAASEARRLSEAGLFLEAALRHLEAGDGKAALDRVLRVTSREPRYAEAARLAVRLSSELDTLSVRFEQFVGAYIAAGPQTEEDRAAFYALGELYVRQRMPENAEEVFATLAEKAAGYRDVQTRLAAVREASPLLGAAAATVFAEDERFRRAVASSDERTRRTRVAGMNAANAVDASDASNAIDETTGAPTRRIDTPPAAGGAGAPVFGPGTVVADRYEVEAEIGRGGMAIVYRAQDLELAEKVALKVFRPGPDDQDGIARFRQELKVSRQLIHPNITRLYDIGLHRGQRYISMELLVGHSVDELTGSPWSARRAIECLLHICEGLHAAHGQGVIHRDIKPGNLFMTREGFTKIMDFGIARQRSARGVTQAGLVVGTPEYLSPEQIRGETAMETSDLYAVGVVAYEIFTGRKPFVHDELVPLLQMHLLAPPQPPSVHRTDLPPGLEEVILRLLQKNPADRFPSARALAEVLTPLRS